MQFRRAFGMASLLLLACAQFGRTQEARSSQRDTAHVSHRRATIIGATTGAIVGGLGSAGYILNALAPNCIRLVSAESSSHCGDRSKIVVVQTATIAAGAIVGALGAAWVARRIAGLRDHSSRTANLCDQRDRARALVRDSSIDDHLEIAARVLPGGFGGVTTTYVFLKRPALADSARRIARALSACSNDEYSARLWSLVQSVEVRHGDYDWIELRKWFDVILRNVSWDGVSSGDIDEGTNRLAYSFATRTALDSFRVRAQARGVPVAALRLSVEKGWPMSMPAPSNP